jgi:hypothetical protein
MNGVEMMSCEFSLRQVALNILIGTASLMLIGCSGVSMGTAVPVAIAGEAINGFVHGGQQPISGATIHLYAAGTGGYAIANTDLLTSPVTTDAGGGFSLSGKYSCAAGQQMYVVALGGNPGGGANNEIGLMAALGDCASLTSSGSISVNEVTTIASVFALAPFMSGYAELGTSSTNTAGLARAFASVNKLANVATGTAPGAALPAGAIAPVSEINTLADILAACVNTTGGVAGDESACGKLFNLATFQAEPAPTDTIGLALAMARHPALNVSAEENYVLPQSPFTPMLNETPSDWTLAVSYTGFNAPRTTTIDANGNVWVANSGNDTMTVLAQSGNPLMTLSGNGLKAAVAVALDANGNAFAANSGDATVSAFTSGGNVFGASPFSVGSSPSALTFDAEGSLWVANSGSKSISELTGTGTLQQTISTGNDAPVALAVDPK